MYFAYSAYILFSVPCIVHIAYLHELVHEEEVVLTHEARLLDAHVVGILEQLWVVRAHIQRNRQHAVGRDTAYRQREYVYERDRQMQVLGVSTTPEREKEVRVGQCYSPAAQYRASLPMGMPMP